MTLYTFFINTISIQCVLQFKLKLLYLKKKTNNKFIKNNKQKSWTLVLKVPTLFPKIRKKYFILIVIKGKNYPSKTDVKK